MAKKKGMSQKQIKSHYDAWAVKKHQAGEKPSNLDYVEHTGKLLSKPRLISDETREQLKESLKLNIDQFKDGVIYSPSKCLVVAKSKEFLGDYDGALQTYKSFLDQRDIDSKGQQYSASDEDSEARMTMSIVHGVASLEKKMGRDLSSEFEKKGISYHNSVGNKLKRLSTRKDITTHISSVIGIVGILGGIFFLSSNITGNAIADLSTNTASWVGGVLLIIGLIAGFFWIKRKK